MKYSIKQQIFLDSVLKGENVFLSGKAGTGKTFITHEAIRLLRAKRKNVAAVAPTGVAANNVGGQTIHSMFSLTIDGVITYKECFFLKQEKRRLLNKIDILFIDEISMVRPDILDAIHWTLKKNGCRGLDEIQIVFIGDFKQLPAVINDNTRTVLYRIYDGDTLMHSKIYPKLNVQNIELDEVLRQSDPEFIEALNLIREDLKAPYFNQFVGDDPNDGIILAPYNSTVEEYNMKGYDSLKTDAFEFIAKIEGNAKADDFNLPTRIKTKNGAKIMYLANSRDAPLVNGTLGIFVSHNGQHYIRVGKNDYPLEKMEFTKKEYVLNDEDELELKEIGKITQYPFKLAYALSIHKAQGLTMKSITVDIRRKCFQKGMFYVAISRVESPEGLRIITNRKVCND